MNAAEFSEYFFLDREVEALRWFLNDNSVEALAQRISLENIFSEGSAQQDSNVTTLSFNKKADSDVNQLRYRLEKAMPCNGMAVSLLLENWESVNYVAVGFVNTEGEFKHIKVPNIAVGKNTVVSFGAADRIYEVQNGERLALSTITDLRIFIKGQPCKSGAILAVSSMACWREKETGLASVKPVYEKKLVNPRVIDAVYAYSNKCFKKADEQAQCYMKEGKAPLDGDKMIDWPLASLMPVEIEQVNTYRFSWQALHPALILLLHANNSDAISPVFAARELVSNWLQNSFYGDQVDKKYTWYDHGTAERVLVFVLMWNIGIKHHFDQRFMQRLLNAIKQHCEVLSSEAFYAADQRTRYHNHAWFQDLALITAAVALPALARSKIWLQTGCARLTDQFEHLIVRDSGYAIFTENSIGYHQGVQRLVEFAGELADADDRMAETGFTALANELTHFSEFFRYPDGRTNSQGDSFREIYSNSVDRVSAYQYIKPKLTNMAKAGYVIVQGNHNNTCFMLCTMATALNSTHKHEDNLSFTLFFDGVEWLIDPSFYSHEYDDLIPAYLRSAAAHNAIYVPQTEYSIMPWQATIMGSSDEQGSYKISGKHSSYKNLQVCRDIKGELKRLYIEFKDLVKPLTSGVRCLPYLMLHAGEGVSALQRKNDIVLSSINSRYDVVISGFENKARISNHFIEGDVVRGISGYGFKQYDGIDTIELELPLNKACEWKISAIRKF